MRRALLAQALFLAAAFSCATPPEPPRPPPRVVILHTNDLHGHARPTKDRGGLPALASKIRKLRAEETAKGARVFVVDCGDFFQGTMEGDYPQGRLIIDAFNEIGYDALCLGNHDFDFGPELTASLARRANFPFLGANILEETTGQPPPYVTSRLSFKDAQLEFVGLISSDMPTLTLEQSRRGLRFPLELETLEKVRPTPRTVLLTHIGHERDFEIARKHRFLAILGGHSHRAVSEVVEGTYVGQAGSWGTKVGVVELAEAVTGRLEDVKVSEGEDPKVQAILARYAPEIDKVGDVVVGELAEDMPKNRKGSSPLGNWICDLMRSATQADLAFHNRTGIRAELKKGTVRERDLYDVSPFHNTLVTMKLTGRNLLALLEHSVEEPKYLLEVSGLEFSYSPKATTGKRVREVTVNGAALDPEKTYTVVTNSFLAPGGDGHVAFTKGKDVKDTRLDMLDMHRDAVKKSSPVRYAFANRIRIAE